MRKKYILTFLMGAITLVGCGSDIVQIQRPPQVPTIIKTGLNEHVNPVYVKIGEPSLGTQDGRSWETAYDDLTKALKIHTNDESLTLVISAKKSLVIKEEINLSFFHGKSLKIYGGFKGDEQDLSEIPGIGDFPELPLTIESKNASRIFEAIFSASRRNILFFGLVIANGNAGRGIGGGLNVLNADIELAYTKWINHQASAGGAIFARNSFIKISHRSEFISNTAENSGGAMTLVDSLLQIDAPTIFEKNTARQGNSGAMRLSNSVFTVNDTTFFKGNTCGITDATAFFADIPVAGDVSKIIGASLANKHEWKQK